MGGNSCVGSAYVPAWESLMLWGVQTLCLRQFVREPPSTCALFLEPCWSRSLPLCLPWGLWEQSTLEWPYGNLHRKESVATTLAPWSSWSSTCYVTRGQHHQCNVKGFKTRHTHTYSYTMYSLPVSLKTFAKWPNLQWVSTENLLGLLWKFLKGALEGWLLSISSQWTTSGQVHAWLGTTFKPESSAIWEGFNVALCHVRTEPLMGFHALPSWEPHTLCNAVSSQLGGLSLLRIKSAFV